MVAQRHPKDAFNPLPLGSTRVERLLPSIATRGEVKAGIGSRREATNI